MSVTLIWSGLEELRAELRRLPEDLTGEASHIVEGAANDAAGEAQRGYAQHLQHPGELQDDVHVEIVASGQLASAYLVKNTSRLAWMFESGTVARHYITVRGNRHLTGAVRALHVFIPAMQRNRHRMYEQLKDLLVQHGLSVSGDER